MTTALLVLNGSLIAGIYAFAKAGTASALGVLAWQLLLAAGNLFRTLAWPRGLAPLSAASLMLALQAQDRGDLALIGAFAFGERIGAGMLPAVALVLAGVALVNRDSLGNVATLRPGDVHLMRAGRGIRHSEMNASATEPEHHLQWWIRPATRGLAPGYQRIHVDASDKRGRFRMLASPEPADGVLHIAQDARVYAALLDDAPARHVLAAGRRGYVHVVSGVAQVGGYRLEAGDAAFVEGEAVTARSAVAGAVTELLLFDLR